MRQAEVLSRFLEGFEGLYPQLAFRGLRRFTTRSHGPYDLTLRVAFGKRNYELDLLCMALTEGYPQEVERAIRRVTSLQGDLGEDTLPVLVAPYLGDEARGLCREAGVAYFDLAGNAGLDAPRAFVEISGKANPFVRERQVRAIFDGKAERVSRALVLAPERRWKIRELSEVAQVSVGMASMVTTALADLGIVAKTPMGLALQEPTRLLEAWVESYSLRRSSFRIFRSWADALQVEQRMVAMGDALAGKAALTLWSGASRLLEGEGEPTRLALYYRGKPEDLARTLRLEDAGRTHIFVFEPYDEGLLWGAERAAGYPPIVHPVQLYLDLSSGDDEEIALAQRVRTRLLGW